jgi:cytoskeletal protein CcmA (bactofilin family)
LLSEGTEIEGEVRFAEELRVDGRIDGKIVSESGRLLVGETGHIEAEIRVGGASISGTVSGTLLATKRVEIHSTGKFYGNIHCPALIIEEGAVFEGNCAMASSSERSRAAEEIDEPAIAESAAG